MKKLLCLPILALLLASCGNKEAETHYYKGIVVYPSDVYSVGAEAWEQRLTEGNLNLMAIHADTVFEPLDSLKKFIESPDGQHLAAYCAENGIDMEYEVHALQALLPRSLYDEHPEYFRMDADGNRIREYNMCFSSDGAYEAIRETIKELVTWLKPTTHRYLFWTDDVNDAFCKCGKCREFSASEQALMYENRLLDIIREFDPEATVAHLTYSGTLAAPEKVAPAEGVFMEFAPIGRNYAEPMNDVSKKAFEDNLAVFPAETAHILEYWLDESLACGYQRHHPKILPCGKERCAEDVAYYRELGVNSVTTFATWLDADYDAMFGVENTMQTFRDYGEALGE